MELELKSQMSLINGNYTNFAILTVKYGEMCKDLRNSPRNRLQHWIDKKD